MPSHRLLSALLVASFAGGAALLACSSSSSSGSSSQCNADPWQCPAGQTCWPSDQSGNFACLNSAVGKNKGDPCVNTPAAPTCGDGMACLQTTSAGGTCLPYCDNTKAGHGCGAGEVCQLVQLLNTSSTFSLCIPTGVPTDSGVDTGSTPPDSGSTDTGSVPPDGSAGD